MFPNKIETLIPDGMRRASTEDADIIGKIIASAFADDPVNKWIFKTEIGMIPTFTAYAKHIFTPAGLCHLIREEAATMWSDSKLSKDLPLTAMPGLALSMIKRSGFGTIQRALIYDEMMKALRPKENHIYLFTVGVHPSAQGKGFGKKILRPVLRTCDTAELPCYLESSNPDNHGFYASLGFETLTIQSPKEGLPPVETMWRKPRT